MIIRNYLTFNQVTISFMDGLLPEFNIPILKSFDEIKITMYKVNSKTKTTEIISIIDGLVEFNLSSITGADVRGK